VLASTAVQEFNGDNLELLAGRAWPAPSTWRWRQL
jgi:hypothetical protein